MLHVNYNLMFYTRLVDGAKFRAIGLINQDDQAHKILQYFLLQIQYADDIDEFFIPDIDNAIAGNPSLDSFCAGTICCEFSASTAKLIWDEETEEIPLNDFKTILLEYKKFLMSL